MPRIRRRIHLKERKKERRRQSVQKPNKCEGSNYHELLGAGTTNVVLSLDLSDPDDLDGPEASPVASSHILVAGGDGVGAAELTELLVHVVGSRAGIVPQPNTKVLDVLGLLLVDDAAGEDLSVHLLQVPELLHEVPEPALGNKVVDGEETHAVDLGGDLLLGGTTTSDDQVFLQLNKGANQKGSHIERLPLGG